MYSGTRCHILFGLSFSGVFYAGIPLFRCAGYFSPNRVRVIYLLFGVSLVINFPVQAQPCIPAASLRPSARPAAICAGESVALSVIAVGGTLTSYTWDPGNIPGTSIAVSPVVTTTYTVSGLDAFGCEVTASVVVTVKPTPNAAFAVTPAAACLGSVQRVTFTGSASTAAAFNWNNFAGAAVQSGSGAGPYTILFNTAGTRTLRLQITDNGCISNTTAQTVNVSTPPVNSFSVDKTMICAGDTVQVTFTGTVSNANAVTWNWGSGTWQSGNGLGPYKIKYNNNGLIVCTINDGVCHATSTSKAIAVIPQPVAAFTTDKITGCAPLPIKFVNQSGHADTYTWEFGDGETAVDVDPVHRYNTTGDFPVTLIAANQMQCADTFIMSGPIHILPAPVASFESTPGINTPVELSLATFQFNNSSQYAHSYEWHFGDGDTAVGITPAHRYMLPGNYQVALLARNNIGCIDSVHHGAYVVIPDKVLQVPNAFSPNGDGVHDRWEIPGLRAFPNCQVTIYNRYGQPVFSRRGYSEPWDGNNHGKPVPPGTYYYVIKSSRGSELYTGWVELLR
ncbi:MAG TPA: PKD domain-containing protein [Niastella sp.]